MAKYTIKSKIVTEYLVEVNADSVDEAKEIYQEMLESGDSLVYDIYLESVEVINTKEDN